MKKIFLVFMIGFVLNMLILDHNATSQPSQKYLLEVLELLADSALKGYNFQDYVKFYEYFAQQMDPVTAKQHFKTLYTAECWQNLGYLDSKKLLRHKSSLDSDFPLLVYEAKFEKHDRVLVRVNFIKEYDNYRITRIRFDKIHKQNECQVQ